MRLIGMREFASENLWMHNPPLLWRSGKRRQRALVISMTPRNSTSRRATSWRLVRTILVRRYDGSRVEEGEWKSDGTNASRGADGDPLERTDYT